jgi:hypothetical protein
MSEKTSAKATFQITGWDENPYAEFAGEGKLTRAVTTQAYSGELVGDGAATMLMYYGAAEAPVHYTGLERFTGSVGGRAGTFVLQTKGTFTGGVADTTGFVVPGSGTGELVGLVGEFVYVAVGGEAEVGVVLDYCFEA